MSSLIKKNCINLFYKILNFVSCCIPIQPQKIFFLSYYGSQYGCNPKYLSEYMVRNCKDWTIVWGLTDPNKHQIEGVKKVKYLSIRYFYELCTSQVFVTNYRMTEYYRKRKGQLYIQTWHSSLRLKKIERDAENSLPQHYVKMAKRDSQQIDILLSGCQFSTDIFKRALWYKGIIVPTGTPREDLMFSKDKNLRDKILNNLGIDKDENIVLYAPTFRKDYSLTCYNIDFKKLQDTLFEKFGGNWKVLLRLHPHLMNYSINLTENNPMLIDVTSYDDIQELLFVSDILISDYSSLVFDFAFSSKPCFLYASDFEAYIKNDRSLYFDFKELPFPLSQDNNTLISQIKDFDESQYRMCVSAFLLKIGTYETGHSCENVVNYIRERIES